jgi:hypothetical protein
MRVKIFYELEINDHDGYCSGEECDYKKIRKSAVVNYQPKNDQKISVRTENWEEYLPVPPVRGGGSDYCHITQEAKEAYMLNVHSHRYTVLKVEEVDRSNDIEDPEEILVDTSLRSSI